MTSRNLLWSNATTCAPRTAQRRTALRSTCTSDLIVNWPIRTIRFVKSLNWSRHRICCTRWRRPSYTIQYETASGSAISKGLYRAVQLWYDYVLWVAQPIRSDYVESVNAMSRDNSLKEPRTLRFPLFSDNLIQITDKPTCTYLLSYLSSVFFHLVTVFWRCYADGYHIITLH